MPGPYRAASWPRRVDITCRAVDPLLVRAGLDCGPHGTGGRATRSVPKVEVVVLGLLAEEPLYGYDLLERFHTRSIGFWAEVGKASVYQTLRRLERRGLITGRA